MVPKHPYASRLRGFTCYPDEFGYTHKNYDEWMHLNNTKYKNVSMNGGYRESRVQEKPPLTFRDDPIVLKVLERVKKRSDAGMNRYGVSMARGDVSTEEWLRHAQEEALDLAVYLERCICDLQEGQGRRDR